jgi:predicted XRE-type DNA-binding protein
MKSLLTKEIAVAIRRKSLRNRDAAEIAGLTPRDVTRIIGQQDTGFSVWKLIRILTAFGCYIEIDVSQNRGRLGSVRLASENPIA